MKKKFHSALLLILIGGGLIGIGYLMGGKLRAFSIGPVVGLNYKGDSSYRNRNYSSSMSERILAESTESIKHLDVDISYASLEIITHNEQAVTYNIRNNTEKVDAAVELNNETLRIKTKKYKKPFFTWFGMEFDERTRPFITVRIPEHFLFETVDITSGIGEIFLNGFNAQNTFTLTTGIGRAEVNNITASNVNIQTGIGEVEFRNCIFTGTVMQTGIGEVTFEGNLLKQFDMDSGLGAADVRINGKKDDYTLKIDSGIGSVFVDGSRIGSIGGSVYKESRTSDNKIHIRSGIGEVSLSFNN